MRINDGFKTMVLHLHMCFLCSVVNLSIKIWPMCMHFDERVRSSAIFLNFKFSHQMMLMISSKNIVDHVLPESKLEKHSIIYLNLIISQESIINGYNGLSLNLHSKQKFCLYQPDDYLIVLHYTDLTRASLNEFSNSVSYFKIFCLLYVWLIRTKIKHIN